MGDETTLSGFDDSVSRPSEDDRVFELQVGANLPIPVLLAVPHGGRNYASDVLASLRHSGSRLRLEDRHADTLAHAISEETGAALLVAKAPRALIDLNRAPDDVDWSMIHGDKPSRSNSLANRRARSGLGLVPRRLPGLGELWKHPLDRIELDRRIDTVHRPYHQALGATLEEIRDHWGAALLIDLHSMPPLRRRYQDEVAPEFVLGDRFGSSCHGGLITTALNYFGKSGRRVAHNQPYSGGYVLDRHGAPRRGIHAMQIEVCRTSYLDSRLEEPSARLPAVARLISGLVRELAVSVAELRKGDQLPQAAE